MELAQVLTIVGFNIAWIAAMVTLVVWAVGKMDTNAKSIATRMDAFSSRMDGHAARIDQLYQMFIALIKEKK